MAGMAETAQTVRVSTDVLDDHYARREASARADKLVREARTRAEHQLAARSTMLDLMEALQLMTQQRRDLEQLLAQERCKLPGLHARVKDLEEQLEEAHDAEERRLAEDLRKKALANGNNLVFNMLLQKSRDVYESSFQKVVVPEFSEGSESDAVAGTTLDGAGVTTADGAEGSIADGARSMEVRSQASSPRVAVSRRLSAPQPTSLADLVSATTGDRVTVKWALTLWQVEAAKLGEAKRLEAEEAARLRAEEERLRRYELAKEEGRAEVRKELQEVEKKLKQERERTKELEAKVKELQIQNERLKRRLGQRSPPIQQQPVEQEVEEKPPPSEDVASTAGSEASPVIVAVDNSGLEEELRRLKQEYERERRSLHDKIRALQEDLLQAHHLAKYLRESALRAKREAANSPARLGDLMMALEAMRDRLNAMERDLREQRESNDRLKREMDANKRHMELERQFLPLLRQAHGPLGRKDKVKSVRDLKDPPWVVEEQHQQSTQALSRKLPRMGSSHSAGALSGRGDTPF